MATSTSTAGAGNFVPIDGEAQATAALDSLKSLAPQGVTGVDPLQALDGVKDGKATLTVPLAPGHYNAAGHGFDVKPGTVAHIVVDVQNGRIVPARDASGQPTGRGTQITVDPPLNLPLWTTGKGAYVRDAGGAKAAFMADVGGWFDQKLTDVKSTRLTDVVRAMTTDTAPGAKNAGSGALPAGLIRTDAMKFDAQVSLTDNVVKLGAASIDLAPGSKVSVVGDGRHASIDGQVNVDKATLNQSGTQLKLGAGQAHLHADYSGQADGSMRLKTSLSNVNARVESLSLEHGRKAGDTDPDRLDIGNATLTNGSLDLDATFKPRAGSTVPTMTNSTMRMHGEAEGALIGGKLTVPDAQDTADLKLGPGRFKGSVDISPGANKLDLDITGTTADLHDLQGAQDGAKIGISSGHIEGDLHLHHDEAAKDFQLTAQARKLDFKIDGYKGSGGGDNVDFKSMDVTGGGTMKISSQHGLDLDGDLHVKAGVNDLAISSRAGEGGVDLGAGTTLEGDATHFHSGGDKALELNARARIDAQVKSVDVKAAGVSARGHGTLQGTMDLVIGGGNASLQFKDATANLSVDDAKMGSTSGALGLDLAKGSSMKLNVADARFDSKAGDVSGGMTLKAGSVIDATVDSGHVNVQGQRVDLDKGSHARFEVTSMSAATGANPSLKGALTLDASVRTSSIAGLQAAGVRVANAGGAAGRVQLTVPDVSMTTDGRVAFNNAHVTVDAKVGNLQPGEVPAGAPVATQGASPRGVLTQAQVKAESVAQIAGATTAGRPTTYDPLEAVKHVKNGTVELDIPVDGTVGSGYWSSANFPKGTTMKLQLVVRDGQIVPDLTKGAFSKPGDAALWFTAKGVHFDADHSLRIQTGGMFGFEPNVDGLDHLPMNIGALVDRLKGSAAADPNSMKAFKLDQASINVQNATFTAGKVAVPGGWIDVGPETKLSVRGTLKSATLSGRVALNSVDIAEGGVALKGSKGSADLNIAWNNGVATTTLDHLNVDTDYAVEKRENGDYLKLAQGHVTDGRLVMSVPVSLERLQAGVPTSATLDIPKFTGIVDGARLSMVDAQGRPTSMEVGRAQVDGEVHIDPNSVQVKGTITNADVAVRGFQSKGTNTTADVEYARLVGSGQIDFSTSGGVSVDANVSSLDVRANSARVNASGAQLNAGRTRITGNGHVAFSSTTGISMEGELHIDSDVSGSGTIPRSTKPAVRRVTVERPN